jgi:hypothetical protein
MHHCHFEDKIHLQFVSHYEKVLFYFILIESTIATAGHHQCNNAGIFVDAEQNVHGSAGKTTGKFSVFFPQLRGVPVRLCFQFFFLLSLFRKVGQQKSGPIVDTLQLS